MPERAPPCRERGGGLVRRLDEHRAALLLGALLVLFSLGAPRFLTLYNATTILRGASLNATVAIGFTAVFILGQLDLSVGAVVVFCGLVAVGLQPPLGWVGSLAVAVLAGAAVGLVNGLLVVKARIDSFIVTLGTLTIVTGLAHLYSGGGSRSIDDFRLGDWLETARLPLLPPRVIITLLLVAGFGILLRRTVAGRNFHLVGADRETAWLAGVRRDRYLLAGFLLSGALSGLGGALFAASLSSMTSSAVLGTRTLMTVLAAVIIGGTPMTRGKGSVVGSAIAVLLLTTLYNGIGCFGYGFEVQIFSSGALLALVVLFEAFARRRERLRRGRRPDLWREALAERRAGRGAGSGARNRRRAVAIGLVAGAGAASLLVALALQGRWGGERERAAGGAGGKPAVASPADLFTLRGTDRQPLLQQEPEEKAIPPRPPDPAALPETDSGHWWDIEYAGWRVEKEPMTPSPGDGPAGKRVVLIKAGDHPYWTAYVRGFRALARAAGIETKVFNSNWNVDLQSQQTDQAINERPDLIVLAPVDATACTPMLRRIHRAGLPCVASNTIPCDEAMRYCLTWTGPDDWGQIRMLARVFADALERRGGYAIVRHMPGSSPFFARTWAAITELLRYAPGMDLLAMDTANLEAEGTMQLVSAWITKFGPRLRGLILAGDGFSMTGALEAIRATGREDLVIVAAGNSKTGMDSVAAGDALAITYQSAEGDGATALHAAVRWFRGEELEPVRYLPRHIITAADVERFQPAQW